jgi:hypothetical protein
VPQFDPIPLDYWTDKKDVLDVSVEFIPQSGAINKFRGQPGFPRLFSAALIDYESQ